MSGCLTCRQRHLKCDTTRPNCRQCQKSQRECQFPTSLPKRSIFRHGLNPSLQVRGESSYGERGLAFASDQSWVRIPPNCMFQYHSKRARLPPLTGIVVFEDETDEIGAEYLNLSADRHISQDRRRSSSTPLFDRTPSILTASPAALPVRRVMSDKGSPVEQDHRQATSTSPVSVVPRTECIASGLLLDEPGLSEYDEAVLLRHFGRVIGPWIDVCDPERHFFIEVMRHAPSCPVVLYACLAVAARHLCVTASSYGLEVAEYYYERCIELLIPQLSAADIEQNYDILLASAVILRLFEQITSKSPSQDSHRHLFGGSAFVNSHLSCALAGGLTEASFWAFVIQDVQFALSYQQPLRLNFDAFDESLQKLWLADQSKTERRWAQRAIWLLAEAVRYCYGGEGGGEGCAEVAVAAAGQQRWREGGDQWREAWEEIKGRLDEWERCKPATFAPLYYAREEPGEGRPWPTVWFSCPWHVVIVQHVCTARIVLMTCDPSRLRVGLGYSRRQRHLQEHIAGYCGILLGAALSTTDAEPRLTACHALNVCGPWVTDRTLQTALLYMLEQTEKEHGWSWNYIAERLIEEWGWSADAG